MQEPIIKKTLLIIRGLPGTGKTVLAKMLTPFNFAADDMPGLYVDGQYQFELQSRSHEWCQQSIEKCLSQDFSLVAVHNGFTEIEHIRPYLELADKYGYSAQVIHCEAVKLGNNYAESVHNVPFEIIESRYQRWEPFRPC